MSKKIAMLVILFISVFFIQIGYWIERKFHVISYDQFLFHLDIPVDGLVHADPKLISSFIRNCLLVPVGIFVFIGLLFKYRPEYLKKLNMLNMSLFLVMSLFYFLYKISILGFLINYFEYVKTGEDYFGINYVSPNNAFIIQNEKPKNLVLIYVESLEDTYSDEKIFPRNLISSIQASAIENAYHFSDYQQAPGTGWTIAGIVSTQCGLPLRTFVRNLPGQNDGFLQKAICLSDILADRGYQNIFMNGGDLSFAGKRKFLSSHSYSQKFGKSEWQAQNKTLKDMNDWGLYDDILFLEAQKKLDELELHPEIPFNLTLLTVDTHPPKGYLSRHCQEKHGVQEDNFEGIVECTALQVRDFINYIKRKGYLKNTTVVVLGDHLSMKNPVYKKLESSSRRRIFNLFISENDLHLNREDMSEFDMFPTILESLGFKTMDGRLGLGFSGLGYHPIKPTLERHDELNRKLLGYSPSYSLLWDSK